MQISDIWCLWLAELTSWMFKVKKKFWLLMYENEEDLTYVCMICWEANSLEIISFQNYFLCALQEADVHIAKGSWYSLMGKNLVTGSSKSKLPPGNGVLFGGLIPKLLELQKSFFLSQGGLWTVWVKSLSDTLAKPLSSNYLRSVSAELPQLLGDGVFGIAGISLPVPRLPSDRGRELCVLQAHQGKAPF